MTGHAPAAKKMALTTPIDKYMKKKTAPQPYQKTGPLQRMIDLEIMTWVATANVPFSLVDQKPFRRCDEQFKCLWKFGIRELGIWILEHAFGI